MFQKKSFQFRLGEHDNKPVIWIQFPNDKELQKHLKSFVKARWSARQRSWYCTDNDHYRSLFGLPQKEAGKQALLKMHLINRPAFQRMRETLLLKSYSANTIKTYLTEFSQLLFMLKNYPVEKLSDDKLRSYFLYCIEKVKLSENQVHSRINAIKFYYEQVLHRPKFFFDIPRPKKPSTVPKVLNTKEILRLFDAVQNPKQLLMLQLCYGMGLRVSEVVKLKVRDIDSTRMTVLIEAAKGKKDRYVPLPASVLEHLREYYKNYLPKLWLFEGQYGGQYSVRSVQSVFRNAMKKAKINKPVGIHGLRHSYATHLLEYGTDMVFIQKLMGHNDIKTTQQYASVSNVQLNAIKSPLDNL